MANESFMDKIRCFLGIRQEPPRNDFRNPIWGSDDEDDGDELYSKQRINIHTDPSEMHREFAKHMHDVFKSFGSMFGDMKVFLNEDDISTVPALPDIPDHCDTDECNSNNIRDYYLKPGYRRQNYDQPKGDVDLDGQISSHEISGLLKKKDDCEKKEVIPFNGNLVPGSSFCKTIITTSVTKPDGTIETRRIIKNGNEVIEETTTSSGTNTPDPLGLNMDPIMNSNMIYTNVMSELSSLFRNFY